MANEITHNYPTGQTLYFCCFQMDGDVFLTGGASDEVWGTGGRTADDYDETMTEEATSGHYKGSMAGGIGAGTYQIAVYLQAGANPADSDIAVAQGEIYWDGSAEINLPSLDTILDTIAVDVAGLDGEAMRGTDGANTTVPDAAGTAAALHAITDGKIDTVDGNVDSILEDTGTTIPAQITAVHAATDALIAALNDPTAAETAAAVWATAMSDLAAGAPSATASVLTAINYLYEAWRNKCVTDGVNGEVILYKDDGVTKLVESDIAHVGEVFTKGKFGAAD